ncbi:hotdog domain-containing protein [Sulfitobacter sp. PR48]|jgi:4-hydroxybenzoyl-CoA thioesterase|uniref:Acyl-CoA thioesterase n=1 Tax=Sulfitobacter porphyrae TaxID=1246864 RepID=A0ABW2B000_9RHOB|nr:MULTISPECIES: thioesterase family protein [unclassified Sulfitobacter]MCZ4254485.1 acyl-CoA thioesterase [Sulfitobacter sp. G21635-S1]MDD9720115.1 hotdog domain-containing protein [Sulfitobacter sp. PR48]GLT09368.1 4-hydroxybenzoyl-CoA thioesterase [Sulfitobacter porphyrae]
MQVPFKTTRMLNFGDCDISGTAYFPSYLNILNGVNEEFWLHLGWPWHKIIWEDRWGTPTVHLSSDFSSPSFFGEELTFEVHVKKVGRSSVTMYHEISCKGEKRWSSTQVLAASDLDKHISIPWPADVKAALEACLVNDTPAQD